MSEGKDKPFGAELELGGTRLESDPVYRDTLQERNDAVRWAGQLHEVHRTAAVVLSAGAAPMSHILRLSVRMDTHKSGSKVMRPGHCYEYCL